MDELSENLGVERSRRSIEASVHSSHQTVKAALDRAQELHITWPLDDDVTNEMLDELFYGKQSGSAVPYAVINYEYIHRELSKKGVTLTLLWQQVRHYPRRILLEEGRWRSC